MKLTIVRHGESFADIEHRYEGRSTFELTSKGHIQATYLSNWLAETQDFTKILSSPLRRAIQTSQHIAERMNLPIEIEELLTEVDLGYVTGLLKEEADILYPVPPGGFKLEKRGVIGESDLDLRVRCNEFISKLLTTFSMKDTICIVSHGQFISTLYQCFVNQPLDKGKAYKTGDTGVHQWEITKNDRKILFSNSQEHLSVLN